MGEILSWGLGGGGGGNDNAEFGRGDRVAQKNEFRIGGGRGQDFLLIDPLYCFLNGTVLTISFMQDFLLKIREKCTLQLLYIAQLWDKFII